MKVLTFTPRTDGLRPLEAYRKAFQRASDIVLDVLGHDSPILVQPDGEALTIIFPHEDPNRQRYLHLTEAELQLLVTHGAKLLGWSLPPLPTQSEDPVHAS
jgi:hypothetical protein